jgi:hypothetical protein
MLTEDQQEDFYLTVSKGKWLEIKVLLDRGLSPDQDIFGESTVFGEIFMKYARFARDILPKESLDPVLRSMVEEYVEEICNVEFDFNMGERFQGALLYSPLIREKVERLYKKFPLICKNDRDFYKAVLAMLFVSLVPLDRKKWALGLLSKECPENVTPEALGMVIPNHFICGQQESIWSWIRNEEGLKEFGDTALHKDRFIEDVELLLEFGADINARSDEESHTAVMRASMTRMPQALEYLLSKSADVNLTSSMGNSALMYVSGYLPDASPMNEAWEEKSEHLQIAKILVEAGAVVSISNNHGHSAIDLARKNKNSAVLNYLESL